MHVVNDIDVTDVRNVVNDIDATDVTSGKYSLMGEMTDADGKAYERFLREGPQEGLTQAEIMGVYKADKQAALNARSQHAVSGDRGWLWEIKWKFYIPEWYIFRRRMV